MKRALAASLMATLAIGTIHLTIVDRGCRAWQDDYRRFLYSEALKNSPLIYGTDDIEAIVGERPDGCARPVSLTDEDVSRFLEENMGPG